MASDPWELSGARGDVLLGTVTDADGTPVEVWRNGDGTASLILQTADDDDYRALTFTDAGLDDACELLGRAAMPGQAAKAVSADG